MELGIFAKTYPRDTLEETLGTIAADGFACTQWNMSCAGLPALPARIETPLIERIRSASQANGVRIVALSATFNLIHPDRAVVDAGLDSLQVLAGAAHELQIPVLTLCSGTRDPHDMWRGHPANRSPEAWSDLVTNLRAALEITRKSDLLLGIEPEPANVVSSARDARRLLDELASDRLGIIFDPANLIDGIALGQTATVLNEAIGLLAPRIVLLHGKDRDASGRVVPAGQGVVPWSALLHFFGLHHPAIPLVLHGLNEADAKGAAEMIRRAQHTRDT